ncbi:MAG: hypothetical protein FJW27_14645 [Acidimicrobiia bacterium]|nr:hypothetical protein [Acidimicrobiia bacterium]
MSARAGAGGATAVAVPCLTIVAGAADLKPATEAAFERYARATERRIAAEVAAPATFLSVSTKPDRDCQRTFDALNRGEIVVEPLRSTDAGRAIDIPGGLVHHWLGTTFLPDVCVCDAVMLLQDYNRHGEIYRPRIERSELLSQNGDRFTFFLRFFMKKVITVVINSEHQAEYVRLTPERVHSRVVSTRIAEVEHPGAPDEREKPVGRDGGYLWRLNTYWRFLERDGGTYLQFESISLTRRIPVGLGWVVGPFINSLPRESLEYTLQTTRDVLTQRRGAADRPIVQVQARGRG